jgi:hypothetical protein
MGVVEMNQYQCADCHDQAIVDNEPQFQTTLIDDERGLRYVCPACHHAAVTQYIKEDHDGFYAASAHHAAVQVSSLFTAIECCEIARALALLGKEYKAAEEAKGYDWQNSRGRLTMLRLHSIFKEAEDLV